MIVANLLFELLRYTLKKEPLSEQTLKGISQEDLKNLLKDYNHSDLIVSDQDVTKFINILTDYDNANNTNFADDLYEDLELCNFDDIKDYLINHSEDLSSLLNYFSDVKDASADYYISDGVGGFKNIEVIDLSYFVEDYIYEK